MKKILTSIVSILTVLTFCFCFSQNSENNIPTDNIENLDTIEDIINDNETFEINDDNILDTNENTDIEWEDINVEWEGIEVDWEDIDVDWTVDFSKIIVRFCNEWLENLSDSLKAAVSQWNPFKVCLIFNNDWEVDANVMVRIVDRVVNDEWDEVCDYNNMSIQSFIPKEDLDTLSDVYIPAHNYVIKEFNINFPIWIGWEQKSCFTYHLLNNSNNSSMLSVVYNRYHNMDFFVWDVWDIKNEISLNQINVWLNANDFLELAFNVDNVWNLESTVNIHWTISNIFWFKKDFEFNIWNIWIWWSLTWIIDLGPLPSYWWLYNIKVTATSTPFFSYNVDESLFDKGSLESKDFTVTTSYFEMPRIIIIILVLIILFIIIAFRKPKEKVVYVQAPQQPTPNTWYQQPQYQQPQYQQPTQPQQPQYPNNPQYGQQAPQNPQATPPQYNPNN